VGGCQNSLHAAIRCDAGGAAVTWFALVPSGEAASPDTWLLSYALIAAAKECGLAESGWMVGQGWFAAALAVDPRDPDRVWAGGIDLFRSDDGGATWGIASYWWAADPQTIPYGAAVAPGYAHADQHLLVFDPRYDGEANRTLYAVNDGGVFRTGDARAPVARGALAACDPVATGVRWRSINSNYAVTQFYHGVAFPDGSAVLGGTQDNGTVLGRLADGSERWRMILGGDGGYVAVDPRDPQRLYAEHFGRSLQVSTDGGRTWAPRTAGVTGFFSFTTPFVLDPAVPDRMWMAGDHLWRSDDATASWRKVSNQFHVVAQPTDRLAVSTAIGVSALDSRRVIVGTREGSLHRTADALAAADDTVWSYARPRAGWVTSVAFDPVDDDVVFATYGTYGGAHVWKSVDGGARWTALDTPATLPDIPAHSLVVDPRDRRRLVLGTELGIFVSPDGGATWAVEDTGYAHVVTETLRIHEHGGGLWLYAFTHGRGAWRVRLGDT
jgi:hypothetical protein